MTVIFFARRFYPLIGGVEKHVLEISKRLVKKGFKVIVITENVNSASNENYQSLPSSDKIEGINILRINTGSEGKLKKFRIWLQLFKYMLVIRSAKIVHCHDIFFWYIPFRFLFPFKKVYTTFHGYEGNNLPTKKSIFLHKASEKLSNGNICVGEFLMKWYGTSPTIITYGATDKIIINKNNEEKNLILFLGRLEEETGIMDYLKAFKEVSKKYKKLKLIVLGDGSQMQEAQDFVDKTKLNVDFKGFVKNVDPFLQRASFVFVSRYLGIIESLMSKKYVLSIYNNEIKHDYLKMTPFFEYISISKNYSEIKEELMKHLLDEDLKNKKIENGYDWVKDKTWDNMTKLYLKLWKIKY